MSNLRLSTKLSKSCTVERYLSLISAKERDAIASFVIERFEERYLNPIDGDHKTKNGFTIMAVSCLMIEALESFRRGWKDTHHRSELAFSSFFSHWDNFVEFRAISGAFYRHVRCGILHQAETTGGWRIVRTGPIRVDTTVNATKFVTSLRHVLRSYAFSLKREDWESETWRLFRRKMEAICRNTEA